MNKRSVVVVLSCLVAIGMAGCQRDTATNEAPAANQQGNDHGKQPWVLDIEEATVENTNFRIARWTGDSMQMTLMSLEPGQEIGLEKHDDMDQFIRIEKGNARVVMGRDRDNLTFDREVSDDWAIFVPGGFWHNVINTGTEPLKLYSIYSPPEHPAGTVHATIEDALAAEHDH
jgi:mannose-6-phosphate isomerase-like protein (cupin superfamily)